MDTTDPDFILQQDLEALAGNAFIQPNPDTATTSSESTEPIGITMQRWQKLFSLDPDTAVEAIQSHRQDLTRTRISDEHWETIRAEQEGQGYNREAYEYELDVTKRKAAMADPVPAADGGEGTSQVTYLVELNGPLSTADVVRDAACMAEAPTIVSGRSVEEGRAVQLCCIDERAKATLLRWTLDHGGGWEPTILADPRSLR